MKFFLNYLVISLITIMMVSGCSINRVTESISSFAKTTSSMKVSATKLVNHLDETQRLVDFQNKKNDFGRLNNVDIANLTYANKEEFKLLLLDMRTLEAYASALLAFHKGYSKPFGAESAVGAIKSGYESLEDVNAVSRAGLIDVLLNKIRAWEQVSQVKEFVVVSDPLIKEIASYTRIRIPILLNNLRLNNLSLSTSAADSIKNSNLRPGTLQYALTIDFAFNRARMSTDVNAFHKELEGLVAVVDKFEKTHHEIAKATLLSDKTSLFESIASFLTSAKKLDNAVDAIK